MRLLSTDKHRYDYEGMLITSENYETKRSVQTEKQEDFSIILMKFLFVPSFMQYIVNNFFMETYIIITMSKSL